MPHLLPHRHVELKPWPFWSQLRDWTADGRPDENRTRDCGPECVAMCLRYLTGVELPADFVKDVLKGQSYTGNTTVDDVAGFLERYAETRTRVIYAVDAHELAQAEWRFLSHGRPLIGLFSFSAPGAPDGHFRCVIGRAHDTVITADPWTGARRVESIHEHWAWSKGLVIGVERRRRV